MSDPVRLSLLGCGTVGGGVLRLLRENADYLAGRVGAPIAIGRVLVRDPAKERVPECRREWLTTDPDEVLGDAAADVIAEVMGGEDPARRYVERAIDAGKGVVTANKLLLAKHGPALVERAQARGVDLAFEASVGGGIPIIRTLREALTSDWVEDLVGIVNGTCNYVLTLMRERGVPFAAALADAQRQGYAEADPTLDVDGHDAAHKLVVLAMLAFGARVPHDAVPTEGIRDIDEVDHRFADRFGLAIKHLAVGRDAGDRVELRVHPALVPARSVLGNVSGVLNAVRVRGRALGPCLLSGAGAGAMPTAVSVVADIVDVARSRRENAAGMSTRAIQLADRPLVAVEETSARYYLRFTVADRPGVLGRIAGALGAEGVSIEQMVQDGRASAPGEPVAVVMVTHRARARSLHAALGAIGKDDFMAGRPRALRIEDV